jgi:putative ABC transport system permease protein
MLWLAFKTLFHEKGRLIITLIGITFSTVLTLTEVAIYLGMMANATAIIRHTDADIWITSRNIQNFDFALPFPEERINQVRAVPGVLWTEKIILTYGFIKLPNGGQDQIQIVGFNPDSGIGGPWTMQVGRPSDVKGGRYMIMDSTSEQRLGRLEPGTLWEVTLVDYHVFKLVGLSQGIKSFTTVPIIFVSYNQAQSLFAGTIMEGQTNFIVAKVNDKANITGVVKGLRSLLRDNDVYTREEFIYKTVMYWTVQTGMGMAFFLTALLAIMIGGAIVGQTIYASTMEHLREFGTLKALGARNWDIYQVIFSQAGISAILGYTVGILLVFIMMGGIEKAGVPLYLHPALFATLFLIILLTCLLSGYFSAEKVRTYDPVTVFKA